MSQPPRRTPEQVAKAFLTPRLWERSTTDAFLPGAEPLRICGPAGQVAARMQGDGPCVIFLHGWEGAPSDFSSFAPPLLAAGFSVLAVDLPAHGSSDGEWMTIPLAAQALLDLQGSLGERHVFHAGIAHSLGAAILVQAMTMGFRIGRVALIAAPADAVDYARDYCEREGLDAHETEQTLDIMQTQYGADVRAISMPRQAAALTQPALFVHSNDDRVVPLAGSLATARAWHGARHVAVEGLGHARLLRDVAVVECVTRFIRGLQG